MKACLGQPSQKLHGHTARPFWCTSLPAPVCRLTFVVHSTVPTWVHWWVLQRQVGLYREEALFTINQAERRSTMSIQPPGEGGDGLPSELGSAGPNKRRLCHGQMALTDRPDVLLLLFMPCHSVCNMSSVECKAATHWQPPTSHSSAAHMPIATCRHAMNAGRCQVHSCHSLAIVAATHATHDAICHADGHVCHLSCDCPRQVVHTVSHLAALFQPAGDRHDAEDNVWLTRGIVQAAIYAAQVSGASQEQPGS